MIIKLPKEKINLTDYFSPSQEVLNAVEKTSILYQIINQETLKIYEKWKDKKYFKGTMWEYTQLDKYGMFIKNLSKGKVWDPLVQAIWLLENTSTEVDFAEIAFMTEEHKKEIFKLIDQGVLSYFNLSLWLSELMKNKNSFDAIMDAMKVSIGVGKYIKIQVLEVGELENVKKGEFQIFNDILEIQHPEELVEYLRHKKNLSECLILTFKRNPVHNFKLDVIMFAVLGKKLYTLDIGERRLNVENVAGCRNPGKYFNRMDDGIWLPYDLLIDKNLERPKNLKTALALPTSTVWKVGTIEALQKEAPEYIYWLTLVLFRVADYIQNNKVQRAYTSRMALKLLEDKTSIPLKRIKSESIGDSSSYLIKKYGQQITAIVPTKGNLLSVIGTKEYVEGLIDYERRKDFAIQLKDIIKKDWYDNREETFKWFIDFVKSFDLVRITKIALKEEKYPIMFYKTAFGRHSLDGETLRKEEGPKDGMFSGAPTGRWWIGYKEKKRILQVKGKDYIGRDVIGLFKERVTRIKDTSLFYGNDLRNQFFVLNEKEILYYYEGYKSKKVKCSICGKFRWKKVIQVMFRDYRQFCAFFNVKPEEINQNIVQHLHENNMEYTGNSILDDTDPADLINDPWFRGYDKDSTYDPRGGWRIDDNYSDRAILGFYIPICGQCLRRLKK